jgi:hypothetical protein
LIFSKGFGQLTRPADGVGTFDPRASKPSVRRAENGGKSRFPAKPCDRRNRVSNVPAKEGSHSAFPALVYFSTLLALASLMKRSASS